MSSVHELVFDDLLRTSRRQPVGPARQDGADRPRAFRHLCRARRGDRPDCRLARRRRHPSGRPGDRPPAQEHRRGGEHVRCGEDRRGGRQRERAVDAGAAELRRGGLLRPRADRRAARGRRLLPDLPCRRRSRASSFMGGPGACDTGTHRRLLRSGDRAAPRHRARRHHVHVGIDRSPEGRHAHPSQPPCRGAVGGALPPAARGRPASGRPALQLRLRAEPADHHDADRGHGHSPAGRHGLGTGLRSGAPRRHRDRRGSAALGPDRAPARPKVRRLCRRCAGSPTREARSRSTSSSGCRPSSRASTSS